MKWTFLKLEMQRDISLVDCQIPFDWQRENSYSDDLVSMYSCHTQIVIEVGMNSSSLPPHPIQWVTGVVFRCRPNCPSLCSFHRDRISLAIISCIPIPAPLTYLDNLQNDVPPVPRGCYSCFWFLVRVDVLFSVCEQIHNLGAFSWAESTQSLVLIPISLWSILILSSHLHLGLPRGLFPVSLPVKIL